MAHTVGVTTCANALGIDYSGPSPYTPPFLPAFLAGILGATIAWFMARMWVRRSVAHGEHRAPAA